MCSLPSTKHVNFKGHWSYCTCCMSRIVSSWRQISNGLIKGLFYFIEMERQLSKVWGRLLRSFKTASNKTADANSVDHSLATLCANNPLTPRLVIKITYKLINALQLLHQCQITHGHLDINHVNVEMAQDLQVGYKAFSYMLNEYINIKNKFEYIYYH